MFLILTEVRTIGQLAKLTTATESQMQRGYEHIRAGFEREIGTVQVKLLKQVSLSILQFINVEESSIFDLQRR